MRGFLQTAIFPHVFSGNDCHASLPPHSPSGRVREWAPRLTSPLACVLAIALALLLSSTFCAAETIDRLVAVVNNQIITLSDLEMEARFYQLEHPSSDSENDSSRIEKVVRREAVERMIEKVLMSEQISEFPGSQVTSDEVDIQWMALRKKWPSEEVWSQMLADLHITQDELKEHLRWQILVLKYVENRFRQFAVVEPGEIDTYYQKSLLPELERQGTRQLPQRSEVEAKIREILTEEKVNQAIEEWMASLKATASIEVFE